MIEKIINFFKRIFVKEEVLKIEAPKENINNFQDNMKNNNDNRMKLLNLQNEIKNGNISEEDLDSKDVNLLKELYCEQILELANSIEYYTKRIKA